MSDMISLRFLLVAYVFCFSLQVDTVGPDNVPQKEKEEARNFCTKELWAPSPYLFRRKTWSVCGTTDTMAESNRKPAKTQTHGGPLQNNTGGTETKEGRDSAALHTANYLRIIKQKRAKTQNNSPNSVLLKRIFTMLYTLLWNSDYFSLCISRGCWVQTNVKLFLFAKYDLIICIKHRNGEWARTLQLTP